MHPAAGAASAGRIPPNAASPGQQRLRKGSGLFHRDAFHPDIRRPPVEVLAVGRGSGGAGVVGGSAEPAGDDHGPAKVEPEHLQQRHQLVVDKDGVTAIGAGKLPGLEMGAQGRVSFPAAGVDVQHRHAPPSMPFSSLA